MSLKGFIGESFFNRQSVHKWVHITITSELGNITTTSKKKKKKANILQVKCLKKQPNFRWCFWIMTPLVMVVFVSVITITVSGSIYFSLSCIEQETALNWVRGVGVLWGNWYFLTRPVAHQYTNYATCNSIKPAQLFSQPSEVAPT